MSLFNSPENQSGLKLGEQLPMVGIIIILAYLTMEGVHINPEIIKQILGGERPTTTQTGDASTLQSQEPNEMNILPGQYVTVRIPNPRNVNEIITQKVLVLELYTDEFGNILSFMATPPKGEAYKTIFTLDQIVP